MKRGVEYLVKDHGMREEDITPSMKEKVRKLIHTSQISRSFVILVARPETFWLSPLVMKKYSVMP
jgi:hypothetical protein